MLSRKQQSHQLLTTLRCRNQSCLDFCGAFWRFRRIMPHPAWTLSAYSAYLTTRAPQVAGLRQNATPCVALSCVLLRCVAAPYPV